MIKIVTFQLIYIFTLVCCYAQDWSPINSYEKFNYRLTGANIVSAQIKVDSAKLINGDSVYYLNRIAKNGNGYITSTNLPQFLQREVILLGSGLYNFRDTLNIVLHTMAPLGYTWLYDSTKYITAQIAHMRQETIFGVLDSVRVISLSSGDTVIVSKSYGIIRYPYEYGNTDSCYTLTGIEGRNVGELLPGFKQVYNWNVGDVFQVYYGPYFVIFGEISGFTINKFTVYSKYVNGDTLKYGVSCIEQTGQYPTIPSYPIYPGHPLQVAYSSANTYKNTLVFIDSPADFTNSYPNQLIACPTFSYFYNFPSGGTGIPSIAYRVMDTTQSEMASDSPLSIITSDSTLSDQTAYLPSISMPQGME